MTVLLYLALIALGAALGALTIDTIKEAKPVPIPVRVRDRRYRHR